MSYRVRYFSVIAFRRKRAMVTYFAELRTPCFLLPASLLQLNLEQLLVHLHVGFLLNDQVYSLRQRVRLNIKQLG